MRYASLVLLAVWIGGLVALGGVTAPALFDLLQAHDPANGRALAGALFGGILLRFQHWSWAIGGLLLVLLGTRAALGPPPRRFKIQIALVSAMLALTTYSALVISPKIEQIRASSLSDARRASALSDARRASAGGAIAALADGDPVKIQFGRLHGLSTGLMVLTLVAGLWAFRIESRAS